MARPRHARLRPTGGTRRADTASLPDHPDSALQNLSMAKWDNLWLGWADARFSRNAPRAWRLGALQRTGQDDCRMHGLPTRPILDLRTTARAVRDDDRVGIGATDRGQ